MRKTELLILQLRSVMLVLALGLAACQAAPAAKDGLVLEEYPLQGPPDPNTLAFQPTGTTQVEVLQKRQAARNLTFSNPYYTIQGEVSPRLNSLGPGQELTAVLQSAPAEPYRQTITVLREEASIFSVDAGLPSPALPHQGLWTYGEHWILEVLLAEGETWQGRIYRDGSLLNQELGYLDAFGFQLLAEEPFYFFQRVDGLGYSFAGQETSLPYEHILHYGCCSAASLNPVPSQNMVAFFALIGEQWFYVELGLFDQD